MYLSRVELDEHRREAMRALANPGVLHGAIESSMPGERSRSLWRIDRLNGKCFLLILSSRTPELAGICAQFGTAESAGETKDYDAFLSRIAVGQRWRFRLQANPIHSAAPAQPGARGKVHAHVTAEQQRQWLMDKAEKNGFALSPREFDTVETRWFSFAKHHGAKEVVTIRTATFEGTLTVTNAELFQAALVNGIGKAKAYGCGLLTVVREQR